MSVAGLRAGAGSFDERVSSRAARRCFGVFAVLLVALALMVAPARADFAAGVAAYDAGNYTRAYAEFLPLARGGVAAAQYGLGNMYRRGQGVVQDDVEAVRWYREAADQGNASAQYILGVMYDGGRGVTKDHSEAVRWYRSAANQGHAFARDQLGRLGYSQRPGRLSEGTEPSGNREPFILACNSEALANAFIFVLYPADAEARLVTAGSGELVIGDLAFEQHQYTLTFPKTENRYETHVVVNRYSGQMEFEAGVEPFGKLSSQNIFWTGSCEKREHERRF